MIVAVSLAAASAAVAAAEAEPQGLCAAAIADLQRAAAGQGLSARVNCRGSDAADAAGAEPVAAAQQPPLRNGRMTWPLRVGTQVRHVPLTVELRMRSWVAARDIAAGEPVLPADVSSREISWVAGLAPAGAPLPAGRLARSVRTGDGISLGQIVPPDAARRGDAVQIVLRQGPLELRVPGHLLAAAHVGQGVRAQPLGRPAAISGVLTTPSTVEAEFE